MLRSISNFFKRFSFENWVVLGLSGLIILLMTFFPAEGFGQKFILAIAVLFVLPALYITMIVKRPLASVGLRWPKEWKQGLLLSVGALAVTVGIIWVVLQLTSITTWYFVSETFVGNFWLFVRYELLVTLPIMVLAEFFRGFVLFDFKRTIGLWAVGIEMAVFLVYALLISDPGEIVPMMFSAVFGALLAYYSETILFSVVYGWIIVVILDAIAVRYQMLAG